jgi:hypothetical protein
VLRKVLSGPPLRASGAHAHGARVAGRPPATADFDADDVGSSFQHTPLPSRGDFMRQSIVFITLGMLTLAACGDSTGPADERPGGITIGAAQTELAIGGSVQLSATVVNTTGAVMSNAAVTWSSSAESVATVSAGGRVTAIAGGTTMIRAGSGTVADSILFTVMAGDCTPATTVGTIAPGQSRSGVLTAGSCILPHGAAGEGWLLTLAAPATVQARLNSSAFDALVVISDMNLNALAFGDDTENSTNALLVAALPAGTYVVWATTFPGETGAYQLNVETIQTGSCTTPRGTIAIGQTVSSTLQTSDCLLPNGSFAGLWQLTVTAETTVQIDLRSAQFDTYMEVTDAAGTVIASDDDGGDGLNSRLVLTLPAGSYMIRASSFDAGVFGAYQLTVAAATAAPAVIAPAVKSRRRADMR